MNKLGLVLRFIFYNLRGGSPTGNSPASGEIVFSHFLRMANLPENTFAGARVLELGPGSGLPLSLRFLAAGAQSIVTIDRTAYPSPNPSITPLTGSIVKLPPQPVDWIISNAVLEEIPDVEAALWALDRWLVPGGAMLHQIDLSDYGMFSSHGFHPLEFLTFSDFSWRAMTARSAGPNRVSLSGYRAIFASLGYDAAFTPTQFHRQDPETVRPRLHPRYRSLPAADLRVRGAFVFARKPSRGPPRKRNITYAKPPN